MKRYLLTLSLSLLLCFSALAGPGAVEGLHKLRLPRVCPTGDRIVGQRAGDAQPALISGRSEFRGDEPRSRSALQPPSSTRLVLSLASRVAAPARVATVVPRTGLRGAAPRMRAALRLPPSRAPPFLVSHPLA